MEHLDLHCIPDSSSISVLQQMAVSKSAIPSLRDYPISDPSPSYNWPSIQLYAGSLLNLPNNSHTRSANISVLLFAILSYRYKKQRGKQYPDSIDNLNILDVQHRGHLQASEQSANSNLYRCVLDAAPAWCIDWHQL